MLLGGALSVPARADAPADLRAFVARAVPMTFADFAPLRGASVSVREWAATGSFGATLSDCLIVDLPSMSALFGRGSGDQPYSSTLRCDGARSRTTQDALLVMADKALEPLLFRHHYTSLLPHWNPTTAKFDRRSLRWVNATGQTVSFVPSSAQDYPDHDGSRLGYVIEVEQLSPQAMAPPTPSP